MTSDTATVDSIATSNPGTRVERSAIAPRNPHHSPSEYSSFVSVCRGFIRYHARPLNVALHCLTTPMAITGVYLMVSWIHPVAMISIAIAHTVWIAALAPLSLSLVSAILIAAMATVGWLVPDQPVLGLVLLAVGFLGQEAAHWVTGEATFQSSYRSSNGWIKEFVDHTILLLPLLIISATRRKSCPLRIVVARQAVLTTKLCPDQYRRDFDLLLDWVRKRTPTLESSTHWWQHDLDGEAGEAFSRLSENPQLMRTIERFHGTGYEVKPALGMNEVYVTGPPKKVSSDTVFYMGHVDGPWSVYPGASLYRCMLALNENLEVTTHYPMAGLSARQPVSYRLEYGDAAMFDFNRELHYITREHNTEQREPRINLKLHFVAYPKTCRKYGGMLEWLTTTYDIKARALFLQTIDPNSWTAAIKARWVLAWTKIFELTVQHIGWTNLFYVVLIGLLSVVVGLISHSAGVACFAAATSFVHYAIYIGTLHERRNIAFARFRRDAMFFKSLSMSQLLLLCGWTAFGGRSHGGGLLQTQEILAACGIVGGFSLAGWAAKVLGMTRTLYSSELGLEPPARIAKAPFGVISHPMIVGAVIAIASTALIEEFRTEFGWLIVGHLVCYAIVLLQEIVVYRQLAQTQRSK
ncbi:methyltransferase [Roseiconus lacunae]|uniref:phosphatidyl-N-methylethanolamine N-methyltransferase n=1 Tax=Roseiconus lacunae TaxID=2605694 RepID=A0ABT7PMA5_9BACT|nr:methyltransferase [Roseiconus lacunae]MDM4017640.1 methyltransferase [Roseiconus lacunae]